MTEVRLRFRDGVERTVEAAPGESVLAAAIRAGVKLVHQCESGSCGTCMARLVAGEVAGIPGRALALLAGEIRDGWRLTCSVAAAGDCAFDLDYPSTLLDGPQPTVMPATVTALDWVAKTVARLEIAVDAADFAFEPGQYVRIRVPGTDAWRSYSMATTAKELPRMRFLIRRLDGGTMSSWLQGGCAPGAAVEVEGPLGSFGLSPAKGPVLMVAGGTGLAPMLAMLDALRTRPGPKAQALLCFGCTAEDDLFYLDELELRRFWMPGLKTRVALMQPPAGAFDGAVGTAVSLIDDTDLARPGLTAYLCGPPPMIEAARERLIAGGVPAEAIRAEHFRPT
ncbi:MAG: FAD-binding oxidoreductase [Rhodospirillaceae bacterium]